MSFLRISGSSLTPIPPGKKSSNRPPKFVLSSQRGGTSRIRRICVLRSSGGIGDLLMSTPTIRQIKEKDPSAYITVAVNYGYLRGALPLILKHNPYVDDIVDCRSVRNNEFSQVIDLSFIKNIYEVKGASPLNKVDIYASRAGVSLSDKSTIYIVTEKERNWAQDLVKKEFDRSLPIIGVQLSTKSVRRNWPHMKKFIKKISEKGEFNILCFSDSKSDIVVGKNIFVANKYNIREISSLIDICDLVVTCDSGIMHIAGALNKNMVCLFGPTHPSSRANYYQNSVYLWERASCEKCPCWYIRCSKNHKCMSSISVESVVREVRKKIQKEAPPLTSTRRYPKYSNRKTRVSWVNESDMEVETNRKVWGAESSSEYLINTGKDLGYDIQEVTRKRFNTSFLYNSDLIVINSVNQLKKDRLDAIRHAIFELGIPYITYQHDYCFCPFRVQIRCNGVLSSTICRDCSSPIRKYGESFLDFYRRVLSNSSLNLFISFPQEKIYRRVYGGVIDPSFVILPPVDPDKYYIYPSFRRDPNLIVCTSGRLNSPNKGWGNIKKYIEKNPGFRYELYTMSNDDIVSFARRKTNVKLFSPIHRDHIPEVYNRASKMLCLPDGPEPAGRTPVEAALCGCTPVMNNNVGVSHFPLSWDDPENLSREIKDGAVKTWVEIERHFHIKESK